MTDSEVLIRKSEFDAIIFDLDGVITRSAILHAEAWASVLNRFMTQRPPQSGEDTAPFDPARDYRRYFDGRPRLLGLKHFLLSRQIDLPTGTPDDAVTDFTLNGLGSAKQLEFRQRLQQDGVELNPCAVTLLNQARTAGLKTALISASTTTATVLDHAAIGNLFDAMIDGVDAQRLDLDPKPDSDTFLEAAKRLGTDPARTVIVEDVVSGVTAAHRGQFGMIVGFDDGAQKDLLIEHGADAIIGSLCAVAIAHE